MSDDYTGARVGTTVLPIVLPSRRSTPAVRSEEEKAVQLYDISTTPPDPSEVGEPEPYYPTLYIDQEVPPLNTVKVGSEILLIAKAKLTEISKKDKAEGSRYSYILEIKQIGVK